LTAAEKSANDNVAKKMAQTVGEGDFKLPVTVNTTNVSQRTTLWSIGEGDFMLQSFTEPLVLGCLVVVQNLKFPYDHANGKHGVIVSTPNSQQKWRVDRIPTKYDDYGHPVPQPKHSHGSFLLLRKNLMILPKNDGGNNELSQVRTIVANRSTMNLNSILLFELLCVCCHSAHLPTFSVFCYKNLRMNV